jgi:hypothetical protein
VSERRLNLGHDLAYVLDSRLGALMVDTVRRCQL